jgi:Protein of unknown function (DUF1592)/Protein of unknown function (DUF1588)/Protein of unknown function (DUF1585)/Protein of unknown function (DUF1587)/Protein of unknown function (DUF1595)
LSKRDFPAAVVAVCVTLLSATAAVCLGAMPTEQAPPPPKHWGVLDQYCVKCHNTEDWAGGVAFDALSPAEIPTDAQTWEKAIRKLRTGMMPPAGKPRPPRAVLDGFATELAKRLDDAASPHPIPGGKSLHRLNRTEYANAVHDVLSFDVDASTLLPADDSAEGFDNIADVLSVSPTLIQSYISAAMKISRWAVGDRTMAPTLVKYAAPPGLSQDEHIEGLPLGTRGGILVTHNFPLDAEYEFRVRAGRGGLFAGIGGDSPSLVDITIDGQQVRAVDTSKFRIPVKAGPRVIGVAIIDRRHSAGVDELYAKALPRQNIVDNLTINGPYDPTGPGDTPSRHAIFVCYPKEAQQEEPCARQILTRLATRGFRRPMTATDPAVATLMQFYQVGRATGAFEDGIQEAVARLLVDPQFLYRIEAEHPELADGASYRVSDIELASRLSFFLWSSIPDNTLLDLAANGQLSQPKVLEQQVRRMLADPHSNELVTNFAGQWLRLRELHGSQPADPEFDDNLRVALEQETQMLFGSVVHEDRSVVDLLNSNYTYVNERLARHYSIPGVHGSYMRRVALPKDSPRLGILGQGSILTITSAGDRTSPVQRGAFVMETLFGAPVPRPPPGVNTDLNQDPTAGHPVTVRERLEKHRANQTCAACHQIMDPIGFSLENFDLDGRWRTTEGSSPIDASGKLVDGTPLNGVKDLRAALLSRSDAFVTSFTEKLLTYALGRRIEYYDEPSVREITRGARGENYRFSAVVLGIVRSAPFQMRVKGKVVARQASLNGPNLEKGKE